jgi:hypothetical protein
MPLHESSSPLFRIALCRARFCLSGRIQQQLATKAVERHDFMHQDGIPLMLSQALNTDALVYREQHSARYSPNLENRDRRTIISTTIAQVRAASLGRL